MQSQSRLKIASLACVAIALSGCVSTTHLTGTAPDTTVRIRTSDETKLPRDETFSSKVSGRLEFVAKSSTGTPFYGVLPLDFHAERIVLGALIIGPGVLIAGVRDAYKQYEFDVEHHRLRYRNSDSESWQIHEPEAEDVGQARSVLDPLEKSAAATATGNPEATK